MPARQDLWTGRLNFLWRGWSPLEWAEDDLVSTLQRNGKPSMLITDHYHLWSYGSGNYHMSFSGMELIRGQERDNWRTDPNVPIRWPAQPSKLNHMWERYARNTAHRTNEEDYFPAQVFEHAAQWIENNHTLPDFFLLIDCFDPHEPFDPPPEYAELYDGGYIGEAVVWPRYGRPHTHGYSAEEVEHCHALYCGEITLVDRWFGRLMDTIEQKGLLANTAIIVTSDHGFLFGEHDWLGKHSPTLYQHIVHTPLILYHPHQRQPGGRAGDLVQMIDLQPTVLQCLNLEPSSPIHGRSLVPLVTGEGDGQTRKITLFGMFGGSVYATDGDWVFVKRAVPGNAPLNWYTYSHFNQWEFGQINDLHTTQQRLQQYHDGRFPAWGGGDTLNHGGPRPLLLPANEQRSSLQETVADELYHVVGDYEQTADVAAAYPDVVERFRAALAAYLQRINAPPEQFDRLDLQRYR